MEVVTDPAPKIHIYYFIANKYNLISIRII
jgi:hypothetical protein